MLISFAEEHKQIPVFQFNRSLMRAGWLAKTFPSRNILLLRRPFDIWKSFCSQGDYYLAALCLIVGQNRDNGFLQQLAIDYEVPSFIRETVSEELLAYSVFLQNRAHKLYGLFFRFYIITSAMTIMFSDCTIDCTGITESSDIMVATEERLANIDISLSLRDCKAPQYALLSSEDRDWRLQEDEFWRIILERDINSVSLTKDGLNRQEACINRPFLSSLRRLIDFRGNT
jgi:hypothetical protein